MATPDDLLNQGVAPEQDYIVLGGVRSPGRATIAGASSIRRWDKQQGYGISGATLAYVGDDLSTFDVEIAIWDPKHWREWATFAKLLERRPRRPQFSAADMASAFAVRPSVPGNDGAYAIVHPVLNRAPIGITSVVVLEASAMEQNETGLWTSTIKFSAWRRPRVTLGTPNSGGYEGVRKRASADDKADDAIAALLREQKALGGVL